jgi:hypothetical protein
VQSVDGRSGKKWEIDEPYEKAGATQTNTRGEH